MSNKKLSTMQKVEKENKLPPKFNEQTNQTENIFDENEKEYPGQDHIESNLEDQKFLEVEQKEKEEKIIIEKKPREEYLKQKMSEMNLDENIINGVSKGLNLQIKNVEDDIEDNHLLITEVTKDLNKIIKNENEENTLKKNINPSKNNIRALKELKNEQNKLKSNIKKLEENEKLIEKEGFLNLSVVDENLKRDKLKEIKEKKI